MINIYKSVQEGFYRLYAFSQVIIESAVNLCLCLCSGKFQVVLIPWHQALQFGQKMLASQIYARDILLQYSLSSQYRVLGGAVWQRDSSRTGTEEGVAQTTSLSTQRARFVSCLRDLCKIFFFLNIHVWQTKNLSLVLTPTPKILMMFRCTEPPASALLFKANPVGLWVWLST